MAIDWNKIIYNSGDIFLPTNIKKILDYDIYTTKNHSFYISGWSILHFVVGMVIGFIYLYLDKDKLFYFYKMLIIHTMWELWQMLIGMSKPWELTGNSNLIDTFVDTLCFMSGAYIVYKIYNKI